MKKIRLASVLALSPCCAHHRTSQTIQGPVMVTLYWGGEVRALGMTQGLLTVLRFYCPMTGSRRMLAPQALVGHLGTLFYRMKNWGPERGSDVAKVTQAQPGELRPEPRSHLPAWALCFLNFSVFHVCCSLMLSNASPAGWQRADSMGVERPGLCLIPTLWNSGDILALVKQWIFHFPLILRIGFNFL